MYCKYRGVFHEAVFEVSDENCEPQIVRQPCHAADDSQQLGAAVARLLNRGVARETCIELREALSSFLEATGRQRDAVEAVTNATRIIEVIELLRIETQQPVL